MGITDSVDQDQRILHARGPLFWLPGFEVDVTEVHQDDAAFARGGGLDEQRSFEGDDGVVKPLEFPVDDAEVPGGHSLAVPVTGRLTERQRPVEMIDRLECAAELRQRHAYVGEQPRLRGAIAKRQRARQADLKNLNPAAPRTAHETTPGHLGELDADAGPSAEGSQRAAS